MKRRIALGLMATLALAPLAALDVSNRNFYRLVEGNTANGRGKVFDAMQGVYLEGVWSHHQTVPGQPYQVSYPGDPGKKYEIFYDAEGFPAHGVQLRVLGSTGPGAYFEGTFKKTLHPFMKATVATFDEGTYHSAFGIDYQGAFQYMPAKGAVAGQVTMGYFIFYGDMVDREEETRETGLFVSDVTVAGAAVRFSRADPSYLTVLQERYQRDMQLAQGEFRKQEARGNWVKVFSVLGQVVQALGPGNLGGGGRNQFALNFVKSVLSKPEAAQPQDLKSLAVESLLGAGFGKLTGNKGLAETLTKAVAAGVDLATEPAAGKGEQRP